MLPPPPPPRLPAADTLVASERSTDASEATLGTRLTTAVTTAAGCSSSDIMLCGRDASGLRSSASAIGSDTSSSGGLTCATCHKMC